jgi:phosphoserine phosphatase
MTDSQIATIVLPVANADTLNAIVTVLGITDYVLVLSNGKAIEFPYQGSTDTLKQSLQPLHMAFDMCVQPSRGRKKTLLICDMDSTLIGQECIDELADFAGVKDHVSGITERAMRGELDFEAALTERVALLKGLNLSVLETCFRERIVLNAGAATLCRTMKANGAKTVIVSGGFTFFTERVAQACGFEAHHANTLLDDGKRLIGDVGRPILGRDAKRQTLEKYCADLGGPSAAIAIGDGANDLAMITAAGLGVAFYAKPAVAAAAHCAINHTDLTTALYFQGYKDSEFVHGG